MDDLDQIKSDPSVIRIYGGYTTLRKAGDKWTGLCPLHDEKSPSFTVFQDMRWTCFGGCGSGNCYQLVQTMDGCDFETAVSKVKSEIGGEWNDIKTKVDSVFKPVAETKSYRVVPFSSWKKFEEGLENSIEAQKWLTEGRGISLETARKLHVGFIQNLKNQAPPEGRDIADKGWLAFPCISGIQITSVKFRSIIRKKPGGFVKQTGMATALWNTESIDPFEPVYLVEGEPDCCVLEQAGFRSVSLASASSHPTPEQKDMLLRASSVILAGDNDGGVGSRVMSKLWKEMSDRTYLLVWPDGLKDANALWDKCGRDLSIFRTTVEGLTQKAKTTPMPDIYSLQETMRNGDDNTLADRPDRLRFPWPTVDKMAILLPGSVLGLMATSTGQGKTAISVQFSVYGARKHNEVVVNWQCELSPQEIAVMVAAQVLRKNRNFITKEDLAEAADILEGVQYYVGNNPNVNSIFDVLDLMEAAIRRLGATVAVLDNVHFYTTGIDDEVRVQAAAMKRIKQISVTYGTKFVVISQPRKATTQTKGKKTHISDAKGSGALGDTCDSFAAIHRDLAKNNDGEGLNDIYEDRTLYEMLKTRSKGVGKSSCYLQFFGEFASFEEIEHNYEEETE